MRDVRGFEPWSKQEQIARDLLDPDGYRQVHVATCNGAGKTTLAAELICHFMATRRNARVITTAGTGAQVKLLWRKVRAAYHSSHRKLGLPEPLVMSWEAGPEWFAIGISSDDETTMQGYHALTDPDAEDGYGDLLCVVDEASGVEDWKFSAIRGYMNVGRCYWLVQGNPNRSDGEFYEISQRGNWVRHQISAFDVPFIEESWIDEQREYWGEEHPQYQVRVLGEFPKHGSSFALFPPVAFEKAADRGAASDEMHMGVDIARGNADRNCAVITRGGRVEHIEQWHSPDLMDTAGRVIRLASAHGVPGEHIHVDVIGLGAGVVDRLREAGYTADGVDFGGAPIGDWAGLIGEDAVMLNRRAELYWAASLQLRHGGACVPREYEPTLWREASKIDYVDQARNIKVEAKDKLRSKLGRSPDVTDAWVLSFSRRSANRFPIWI